MSLGSEVILSLSPVSRGRSTGINEGRGGVSRLPPKKRRKSTAVN